MAEDGSDREIKRRRVTRACESCRRLKAKCDGKQPVCNRCVGYGHSCVWNAKADSRFWRSSRRTSEASFNGTDGTSRKQLEIIASYDRLVEDLRQRLDEDDRRAVAVTLANLRQTVPSMHNLDRETGPKGTDPMSDKTSPSHENLAMPPQRYLGEASEVRFLHIMKQTLSGKAGPQQPSLPTTHSEVWDSYEQDEITRHPNYEQKPFLLPPRATADSYLQIFFSTIHTAYPFVCQQTFQEQYEEFWKTDAPDKLHGPWLSLLLTIFALAACYDSFSKSDADHAPAEAPEHRIYFEEALQISQQLRSDTSLDHICALLAQCFYLLATSEKDLCWTQLGFVIRLAQAVGLHVEGDAMVKMGSNPPSTLGARRRVWYSLYILDQLVALQLSRPPAIRQGDFNVSLPQSDDGLVPVSDQPGTGTATTASESHPWIGDYFIAMIHFSHIIGQVLRSLYSPVFTQLDEGTLSTIETLDHTLLQWKFSLPRSLRFDLGHPFEKSETFRRQRNMLAIKFYNLRALIHRPFLSRSTGRLNPTPVPNSNPDPIPNPDPRGFDLDGWRVSQSKRACVDAAQQTARLLHNIPDKRSLVFDFPWWQMISCLICASSILLVARILLDPDQDLGPTHDQPVGDERFDWAAVEEDADLCLRVFEVLSTNSKAARLARDMMEGLKETRSRVHLQLPKDRHHQQQQQEQQDEQALASLPVTSRSGASTDGMTRPDPSVLGFYDFESHGQGQGGSEYMGFAQGISEPVMWSAQFVDAAYNPFLGYSSATTL